MFQCDSWVPVQPALKVGVFTGGVVVADDAQPDPGMDLRDEFEEGQELDVRAVPVAGVGGDLAGADLERGEHASGAVRDVVVDLLLGNRWRRGRIEWVQSRTWLWNFSSTLTTTAPAGHPGKPDHVAQLALRLGGVGGELEGLHTVGLDARLAPDPRHRGERDPPPVGRQPSRLVRHTQMRRRSSLVRQRLRQHRDLIDVAARPGRGSSSPSTPECAYRPRHLSNVGRDVPVRSAISALATPSGPTTR
jgi:hypothetical protein